VVLFFRGQVLFFPPEVPRSRTRRRFFFHTKGFTSELSLPFVRQNVFKGRPLVLSKWLPPHREAARTHWQYPMTTYHLLFFHPSQPGRIRYGFIRKKQPRKITFQGLISLSIPFPMNGDGLADAEWLPFSVNQPTASASSWPSPHPGDPFFRFPPPPPQPALHEYVPFFFRVATALAYWAAPPPSPGGLLPHLRSTKTLPLQSEILGPHWSISWSFLFFFARRDNPRLLFPTIECTHTLTFALCDRFLFLGLSNFFLYSRRYFLSLLGSTLCFGAMRFFYPGSDPHRFFYVYAQRTHSRVAFPPPLQLNAKFSQPSSSISEGSLFSPVTSEGMSLFVCSFGIPFASFQKEVRMSQFFFPWGALPRCSLLQASD